MMGQGPGWRWYQRSVEELVKAETRNGPRGELPRRSGMWRGAAVAFAIVSVLMLLVLVTDCADGQPGPDEPASSPAVTRTTGAHPLGGGASDATGLHLGRDRG